MQVGLNELMDTLAQRLRAARTKANLTQEQLAKRSGVKQPDISKIERGEIVKTTAIPALARETSCDADWLELGIGEPDFGRIHRGWPFPDIARKRWTALTDKQRAMIEGAVQNMLVEYEASGPGRGEPEGAYGPHGRLPAEGSVWPLTTGTNQNGSERSDTLDQEADRQKAG